MLTTQELERSAVRGGISVQGAVPDKDELGAAVREPAEIGRWLLLGSEASQTGLLMFEHRLQLPSLCLLIGILIYNIVALVVLRLITLRRGPVALSLVIDLILVYAAAYSTGASKSPFLGQFYLIVFADALFFGHGVASRPASLPHCLPSRWASLRRMDCGRIPAT